MIRKYGVLNPKWVRLRRGENGRFGRAASYRSFDEAKAAEDENQLNLALRRSSRHVVNFDEYESSSSEQED